MVITPSFTAHRADSPSWTLRSIKPESTKAGKIPNDQTRIMLLLQKPRQSFIMPPRYFFSALASVLV